MTWRYIPAKRLVNGEEKWSIHEYYDGEMEGWTQDSVPALGDSLEDLRHDLTRMLNSLENGEYLNYDEEKVMYFDA